MCFYNDDYEWTAESCEATEGHGGTATRCIECGAMIAAGEYRRHVYQRERESCQVCEDEWSDDYDDEQDKATCKHDYGNEFTADTCEACCNLLVAVRSVEVEAGCPEHAQVPAIGELRDSLIDHHEREVYARRAVQMFPELASHEIVVVCLKGQE